MTVKQVKERSISIKMLETDLFKPLYTIMTAAHSPSAFTLLSILCLHVPGCARLTLYE